MATKRMLRKNARQIAQTQNDIQSVHQDTAAQAASLQSMNRALQNSIGKSAKAIGSSPDLLPQDRAMATRELASRRVDAAAGATLAVQQTQRDAQGQLADLTRTLGDLHSDRSGLIQEFAAQKAARAQSAADAAGLTPTQRRSEKASKQSALQAAGQLYRITVQQGGQPGAGGSKGPTWDQFVQQVAKAPGVSGASELQHATNAVSILRYLLAQRATAAGHPPQGQVFTRPTQRQAARHGNVIGPLQ